jgi:AcrR family transcriptional regulator
MTTTGMGLRERKRVQTRRRLEEAAIGLALRDGLDKVTIEAISERADVSRRTFFNYFDSKDDAILGVNPPDVSTEALAGHLSRYADADIVESIIGLIVAVLGPSIDEPALRQSRLEVIRQNPQLLERLLARMARMTEQLTAAASALLARNGPASGDQAVPDGVAETVLMTCAGAVRAATRQWSSTDTDLSLEQLEQRAVSLVREAIETLT